MNRDEAYLQRMLAPMIGDVRAKGFESHRAALDQAIANIQRQGRVMHGGSPTGNEYGVGEPDTWAGYIPFGGNKHLNAIVDEVARLEKEAPKELRELATRRGYYGANAPRGKYGEDTPPGDRFDTVKNYRERTMEGYDANGERVTAPVLGNGHYRRDSRYDDVPDAEPGQITYGNPKTNRGSDQESRFGRLPDPPLKADGSVDCGGLGHATTGPLVAAMQQIADWLKKLGMSEYAARFAENGIDFSVLRHLTDQDLKDIGVLDARARAPLLGHDAQQPRQRVLGARPAGERHGAA